MGFAVPMLLQEPQVNVSICESSTSARKVTMFHMTATCWVQTCRERPELEALGQCFGCCILACRFCQLRNRMHDYCMALCTAAAFSPLLSSDSCGLFFKVSSKGCSNEISSGVLHCPHSAIFKHDLGVLSFLSNQLSWGCACKSLLPVEDCPL